MDKHSMAPSVRVYVLRAAVLLGLWIFVLTIAGGLQAWIWWPHWKLSEYVVFALWATVVMGMVVWTVIGAMRLLMKIK